MKALILFLAAALVLAAPLGVHAGDSQVKTVWTDDSGIVLVGEDGEFEIVTDDEEGGYLGVTLAEVDEDLAEDAGLAAGEGALVQSIFDDSPADEAGLEAGDVIVKFAGTPIAGTRQLAALVRAGEPGDEVPIELRRDGKKKSLRATLGEREAQVFVAPGKHFPHTWRAFHDGLEDLRWAGFGVKIGVEVRDLDEDLAEYFPGSDGAGALILSVDEDSPAGKGGLKAGDVIVRVDERDVSDVDDLHHALRKSAEDEPVAVDYVRRGERAKTQVQPERGGAFLLRNLGQGKQHMIRLREELEMEDVEDQMEALQDRLKAIEKKLEQLQD